MEGTQLEEDANLSSDRRLRPRVTVAVPFRLFDTRGRLLLQSRTLDLSTGGALLHGICKAEVGDAVRVEIGRGAARNPLTLRATVVRMHAPRPSSPRAQPGNHGVAVRFEDVSAIDEVVLRGVLKDARS